MALLNEELSLWEIAFRWESRDPDHFWPYLPLPLPVRDRFRTLMDAILNGHLDCNSLFLRRYHPDTCNGFEPEFFIRHHIDDVNACIWGKRYKRSLLRWACIEREALQEWCERQGVPLPEFWFPPGWKLRYEWPEDTEEDDPPAVETEESPSARQQYITRQHRTRMACQQAALYIWHQEPRLDIKAVANRPEVQEIAGGKEYVFETVCTWLGEVDPRNPAQKRGRKRKNNSPPDDAEGQQPTDSPKE